MELKNKLNCPICQSVSIKSMNWGKSSLKKCMDCDIHFVDPIPSEEELKELYKNSYSLQNESTNYNEYRRIFRLPEQIKLIGLIKVVNDKKSKLLDIGCDRGFFIDEARRHNIEVFGVEPSDSSRKYCENIGLKVYSDLYDDDIPNDFDFVTMWHSLEHFINPNETIKKIYSKINQNGTLIIRVPAFDSFESKLLKSRWVWFQSQFHYFHYSLKSLTKLLENNGFEVIEIAHSKPNNAITSKFGNMSGKILKKYLGYNSSFKSKLSMIYQRLSAKEIICVAIKK